MFAMPLLPERLPLPHRREEVVLRSPCIIMMPIERCQDKASGHRQGHRRRPVSLDLTQLVFMVVAVLIIFGVYGRSGPGKNG